jgi:hypothetical protein
VELPLPQGPLRQLTGQGGDLGRGRGLSGHGERRRRERWGNEPSPSRCRLSRRWWGRPRCSQRSTASPGAAQQQAGVEGQAEARAGEIGADVGRQVVPSFVIVDPGAPLAKAADGAHPLLGHQLPKVGGQIPQPPRLDVLVHGQGAGGVYCHHRAEPSIHNAAGHLCMDRLGHVQEPLPGGLK